MSSQPMLEIHLHLVNGNTHRFVQNDPAAVEEIVQQINQTVFTHPTLVIHGQDSLITYPTKALIGISLVIDPIPDALLHWTHKLRLGAGEIHEITEDDYKAARHEVRSSATGEPSVRLNEIQFVSGHRLWLAVFVQANANEVQERQLVKHAFDGPPLVCRRHGGGVSLWNRANMVSHSFTPKPEVPLPAFYAEELDHKPVAH